MKNKISLLGKVAIAFGIGWSVLTGTGCKKVPEPKQPIPQTITNKINSANKMFGGRFNIHDENNELQLTKAMEKFSKAELKKIFGENMLNANIANEYNFQFINSDLFHEIYLDIKGDDIYLPAFRFAEKYEDILENQGTVIAKIDNNDLETPLKYLEQTKNHLIGSKNVTIKLNDNQYEFENYEILKQIKEDLWKEEKGASGLEKEINNLYEKSGYFERNNIKTPIKYMNQTDTPFLDDQDTDKRTALIVYFDNNDSDRTEFKFYDEKHLEAVKNTCGTEFKDKYDSLLSSRTGYIEARLNNETVKVSLKHISEDRKEKFLNASKINDMDGEYVVIKVDKKDEKPYEFNLCVDKDIYEDHFVFWNDFGVQTEKFLKRHGLLDSAKTAGIEEISKMYECINNVVEKNNRRKPFRHYLNSSQLKLLHKDFRDKKVIDKMKEYFKN